VHPGSEGPERALYSVGRRAKLMRCGISLCFLPILWNVGVSETPGSEHCLNFLL
jgi:hypothetical protein